MSAFEGVFANLPTPFDDTGERLDLDRLERLLAFLLGAGIHGVACLLSSGEYPYLRSEERKELAQAVVRLARGRVPVIVGISALTTTEAVDYARFAESVGADAVMLMPMQYWPLRREEVVDLFRRVAGATRLPLGVYDNPPLGGYRFGAELYARLADEANVQLSKDSSGDITHVSEVVSVTGGRVAILHGNHMEMLPAYLLGASGVCTAMAAVFPEVCLELHRLARLERRWDDAQALFVRVQPLFRFCQAHALSRCTKVASHLLGRPLGPQRRPLTGLAEEELTALKELLSTYALA